jgi:HD superfamily phosphohydrolase YqeK
VAEKKLFSLNQKIIFLAKKIANNREMVALPKFKEVKMSKKKPSKKANIKEKAFKVLLPKIKIKKLIRRPKFKKRPAPKLLKKLC